MADFFPHRRLRTIIDPSMDDLPTELTVDILSRLPVKTIIHCKLVCNKWRNLVSDSSFVKLHLSRSPTSLIIHHKKPPICTWYNSTDPGILKWVEIEDKVDRHRLHYDRLLSLDLNLAPILQNTWMHHVGSVNGLICLWQYRHKVDNIYICNPVTREYMILPRPHVQTEYFNGAIVFGFGVSSLTGEYKVVRVQREYGQDEVKAEVYTLGTGRWRTLGPLGYWRNVFLHLYGTFLNNHCHWIVYGNKICTFDFDKETFQLLPSPPPPVKENRFHGQSLAILIGCLCKLDTYHSELTIWVMKEYGINNSWRKQVVIRPTLRWPLYEPIHLVVGLKDGSFLMVFENKLCVFDPRSQKIDQDTKMFDPDLRGLAFCPSFLKLQNFESEMVHMF